MMVRERWVWVLGSHGHQNGSSSLQHGRHTKQHTLLQCNARRPWWERPTRRHRRGKSTGQWHPHPQHHLLCIPAAPTTPARMRATCTMYLPIVMSKPTPNPQHQTHQPPRHPCFAPAQPQEHTHAGGTPRCVTSTPPVSGLFGCFSCHTGGPTPSTWQSWVQQSDIQALAAANVTHL